MYYGCPPSKSSVFAPRLCPPSMPSSLLSPCVLSPKHVYPNGPNGTHLDLLCDVEGTGRLLDRDDLRHVVVEACDGGRVHDDAAATGDVVPGREDGERTEKGQCEDGERIRITLGCEYRQYEVSLSLMHHGLFTHTHIILIASTTHTPQHHVHKHATGVDSFRFVSHLLLLLSTSSSLRLFVSPPLRLRTARSGDSETARTRTPP